MLQQIKAWWRLTRFEHALLYAGGVLIGEILAGGLPSFPILALSLLVPILVEIGAFSLNDFVDVEVDKANNRNRPLVKGEVKLTHAYRAGVFALSLAIGFAFALSTSLAILTLLIVMLAVVYNFSLKRMPLVGNVYIAFSMAVPFIFGNLVVSQEISAVNALLALGAFSVGFGREVIKDILDREGDEKAGMRTLAVILGKHASLVAALSFSLALAPGLKLLSLAPFSAVAKGLYVLGLILAVLFPIAASAHYFLFEEKSVLKWLRTFSLVGLGLMVLALLMGPWSNLV